MSLRDIVDDLRNSHDNHPSLEDQIKVYAVHHWGRTSPDGDALTKSDIEDALEEMRLELDCNIGTVVGNLVGSDFLGRFRPTDGPEWFVIRQRDGEFVMGDDTFPPAVHEECERVLEHIRSMDPSTDDEGTEAVADGGEPLLNDDGETLREEVAHELEIEPGDVEAYLQTGRPRERRSKLNNVVEAVEESATFEKPESYDKIVLRRTATRYHRSEQVINGYY